MVPTLTSRRVTDLPDRPLTFSIFGVYGASRADVNPDSDELLAAVAHGIVAEGATEFARPSLTTIRPGSALPTKQLRRGIRPSAGST